MKTPRFSVVIPVYNAGFSLEATVESVLCQTERDFDLWLIDDGSTDDSLSRMRTIAEHDDRIRVISKSNGGVSSARNLGAELSGGTLIAFLDADDLWHPEKLAVHGEMHSADPSLGGSYAQIAFLKSEEHDLDAARTRSTVASGPLALEQVLGENPVCTGSNIVVTRECFENHGGFRTGMNHAEDQEWLARIVAKGEKFAGIDSLLVGYRLSPDGLSCDLQAMYDGWRELAQGFSDSFDKDAAEALYCRYLSRRALRNGSSPGQALHFTLAGLRCDANSFMNDIRRGGLTLASALANPLIPGGLRTKIFA